MRFTGRDFENSYQYMLFKCMNEGVEGTDRTGVGTRRLQHAYFEWEGMACIRRKKIWPQRAIFEMLWMLMGSTKIEPLKEKGINYWDSWVFDDGDFGPIYGHQFRNFGRYCENGYDTPADQLQNVIDLINNEPDSRRMIISLWNPCDLEKQALPPCHCFYQFTCVKDTLHLHVYQRSADAFLGVPYNFVMSSAFLGIVAEYTGKKLGKVHYTCADFHVYLNHLNAIKKYLNSNDLIDGKDIYDTIYRECKFLGEINGEPLDDYLNKLWSMDEIFDMSKYVSGEFIGAKVAV